MRLALLLVLWTVAGCTSYWQVAPGPEPNHYYVIQTTSFLFFSKCRIVEYERTPGGDWKCTRTILPLPPEPKPAAQQEPEGKGKEEEKRGGPPEDGGTWR